MVGVYVDDHAGDENGRPDDELRGFEPSRRIEPLRSEVEYPAALHDGVHHVEEDSHGDNRQRHPAPPLQQKGKDEGPLEIVELEQEEKTERRRLKTPVRHQPQHGHQQEDGRLHHEPAHFVGYCLAPLPVQQHAVPSIHEEKRDENHYGQHSHDDKQDIECLLHIYCTLDTNTGNIPNENIRYTGCIEAALLSKYRNIFDENRTQSSNNSPVRGRRHDSVEANTKELQRPDAASICADTPLGGPHRT